MKKQADLFKPITPDFHASIEDALAEAQAPKKKRKMPLLIPGVMLAAILFPGLTPVMFPNVLGTPDEPTLVPETIGKYAFDLNVVQPGQTETAAPATAGPEFVKLIVDPIEGYMDHEDYYAATIPDFVRDPRCEGVKWAPVDNHSASGYSFSLSRPKEGEQLFNNVGSYKTLTIAGREAIIIEPAGSYPLRRVMMMYKKVNILVICYINMKIPMADMITALEGVNVIEGTLENHTPYSVGYKSASSNAGAPVSAVIAEDLIFPEIGEEFTRHENITAKMESIEILSNVKNWIRSASSTMATTEKQKRGCSTVITWMPKATFFHVSAKCGNRVTASTP